MISPIEVKVWEEIKIIQELASENAHFILQIHFYLHKP